jgi:hypothetical protein
VEVHQIAKCHFTVTRKSHHRLLIGSASHKVLQQNQVSELAVNQNEEQKKMKRFFGNFFFQKRESPQFVNKTIKNFFLYFCFIPEKREMIMME